MKYAKIVEWSEQDQYYIGSIPALTGPCANGQDERVVFDELCRIEEECLSTGDDLPPCDSHPPLYETITAQCDEFNAKEHMRLYREKVMAKAEAEQPQTVVVGQ